MLDMHMDFIPSQAQYESWDIPEENYESYENVNYPDNSEELMVYIPKQL